MSEGRLSWDVNNRIMKVTLGPTFDQAIDTTAEFELEEGWESGDRNMQTQMWCW